MVAVLALVVLAATLALAAWLALKGGGPLGSRRSPPGVLRVGLSQPLSTLDPTAVTSPADRVIQAMVYEGVLVPGADGTLAPEPRLAETLPRSSTDGLVWTVHCRRDVSFHDGEPFTCRDVEARLESLRANPGALADSDVDPTTLVTLLSRVESTQLVDEHTLNVSLRAPFAFFNEALAHPAAVIARGEVGTGPFQVEMWDADGATLAAFDDYWGGPPELERVTIQVETDAAARIALLGDRFDVVDAPPPNGPFDDQTQVQSISAPGAQVIYAAVKRSVAPLDDPQIRQALATGIDLDALADQVYGGRALPAPLLTSPAMPGYADLPTVSADLRRAREMQANAGLPDGYDVEVRVDRRIPYWESLAEALRLQLEDLYVGGSVEALRVPLETFLAADPALSLVVTAYTPPDTFAALSWLADAPPPGGRNFVGYDNPAYRAWLEQAGAALSPAARETALAGAREELAADSPLLFLVAPDVRIATTSEVSGLRVSPLGWMVVTGETLVLRR